MTSKNIVAEFDIDVNHLITKTKEAKQAVDTLTNELKKLKEKGDTSSSAFVKTESALKKARTEYSAYSKNLQANVTNAGKLANVNERLINSLEREIKSIEGARKSNKELLAIRNQLDLSTKEGIKANEEINKKLNENNAFIKDNSSAYEQQKIGIGGYEEAIKNALNGTDLFGVSITNITNNFTNVFNSITNVSKGMLGLSASESVTAGATNMLSKSLRVFKVALISTGIGAFVVAIASLKSAFASSEEGQNKWNKIMSVVGAIVGNLTDLLADLGEKIISVFENPKKAFKSFSELLKKNIINRFEGLVELIPALGKSISLLLKGEFSEAGKVALNAVGKVGLGVESLTDNINSASDATKRFIEEQYKEGKAAATVADMRAKADKIDRQLKIDRAKLEAEISELRLKSREEDKYTASQRSEFLKKSLILQDSLIEKEMSASQLRYEAQKMENSFARSNKENLDKEAEAEARLSNIKTQRLNFRRQIQRELIRVSGQKRREEAEAQKKAITHQERLLQLYILTSKKDKSSLEEKLKVAKEVYKKELALIEQKAKAGLSATEVQIEQEKARQKYIETQTSLALENVTKELEIYTTKNAHILDSEGKLNADLLAKQKAFLDEKARLQIEALKKENLSKEEFEAKKAQIERERDVAKREKDKAIREQEKADRQKDFEDKQALQKLDDEIEIQNLIEKNATTFEIQQVKLEQETTQKIQAVENEKTQLDAKAEEDFQNKLITQEQRDNILLTNKQLFEGKKLLIEKQSAEAQKQIEFEKNNAKLKSTADLLGNVAQLLGENTEAGKAAAIAQATINTYQGVTEVWTAKSVLPEPFGTIAKVASTAVVLASGLSAVKKIQSTKTPKASKGITLKGNSHANGGVGLYDANGNQVVEAEGGENVYAITNKKASSLINGRGLLGALSYINERTGGIPLTKTVNYASMGGLVSSSLKKSTNVREVVDAFEQREKTLRVINVAEETMSIGGEGVVVENLATM